MKRKPQQIKNRFLLAALAFVGIATVAYAAFATTLSISGTGTASGNWNVAITNMALDPSSVGATNKTAPVVAGNSPFATFDANLAYPGATAVYNVTIKNGSNLDAKLSTLSDLAALNATAPAYITYTLSGVGVNDILAACATANAKVTVTWAATDTHSGTVFKSSDCELWLCPNT